VNSNQFAEEYLLNEVKLIEAANVRLHLLAAIVHGIETAGALLDDKPFKAKGQGKRRFDMAVKKLFAPSYFEANSKVNLYSQLRSHMAHCMLPAKTIQISEGQNQKHLKFDQNMLQISLPQLFDDYCCAIEKLISMLETNQLKPKRIIFDNLDLNTR